MSFFLNREAPNEFVCSQDLTRWKTSSENQSIFILHTKTHYPKMQTVGKWSTMTYSLSLTCGFNLKENNNCVYLSYYLQIYYRNHYTYEGLWNVGRSKNKIK